VELPCSTDKGNDKTTWDWAILTGQVWKKHGKVVWGHKHLTSLDPSTALLAILLRRSIVDTRHGSF
jgi:hypothetical protein